MQRKHRQKSATRIEKHNSNKKAWQLKQKSTTQTKEAKPKQRSTYNTNRNAQLKQRSTTQTKKHNANKTLAVRISGALAQNPLTPGLLMNKVSKPQSFQTLNFFRKRNTISFWEVASCFVCVVFFYLRCAFLICLRIALCFPCLDLALQSLCTVPFFNRFII